MLCGDVLDGHDAVTAGLAWRCVDEADLEDRAHRLARRAAGRSRPLVARAKATLRASQSLPDVETAAALELEAQQWSMDQPGFDDGIRAIQASIRSRSGRSHGRGRPAT